MHGERTRAALLGRVDRHHMVGVRHLQPAVIGLEPARDEALGALRQQALEIGGIGIEIDELEGAPECILDQDACRARAAPRRPPPGRCSPTVTSSVASSPIFASETR